MAENEMQNRKAARRRSFFYILFAILILAASVLALFKMEQARQASLKMDAEARENEIKAGPVVKVVNAKLGSAERHIDLPGEARPYHEVTIYAKVSGYVREIKVDYGDVVKVGQLLAVLESPELDRQYDAAVSDMKNKELMAKRGKELVTNHVISIEDSQTRDATAQVARATVESLAAQKQYEIIQAPFAGTITTRFVDPGALVQNAGNSQGNASPVVTVSQVDKLKVYAYASQKDAAFIRVGDAGEIRDLSRPEVKVKAALSRTSVQLTSRTRTLLLEFDVDNSSRTLVPGSFIQVAMTLKTPAYVEIPAGAMIFQANKPYVAILDDGNKVGLRPIAVAETNGSIVKVASGVTDGERIVLHGGNRIVDGALVRPAEGNAAK